MSNQSKKSINDNESSKELSKTIDIDVSTLGRNVFGQRAQSFVAPDVRLPVIRVAQGVKSPELDQSYISLPIIFKQPNRSPNNKLMRFGERGAADKLKRQMLLEYRF